jgi:NADP-dependent aldehyde dehydrogenase
MKFSGHHSIAGEWQATSSAAQFYSINPRTQQADPLPFYDATSAEVDAAVQAAADAFRLTRGYSATRLADFLEAVAGEIEALGDLLLQTADHETALGLPRLTGERGRTAAQLRAFAALLRDGAYVEAIIDTALPERQPAPRPDLRRMLHPIGPVVVFSASNFPFAFAVPGGDTASAWAAGCPVVVKGHPGHPMTSELFAHAINSAIQKTGFPAGFFSLLQGAGVEVAGALVQHPLIEAVGFTGSLRGGRALFDLAARRPKPIPVYAEMGSVNPSVILPGALAARAESLVAGLMTSATLGAGQFCTNPGLVLLVDSPAAQDFIADYAYKMGAAQPGVLLNEKIQQGLRQTVDQTLQKSTVQLLVGGQALEEGGFCYANTVMQTTAAALRADSELQNEHFGAVTLFVLADSVEDLAATIPHLHGNLTATIHAEAAEAETARSLYAALQEKVGRLIWNGFPTGVEVVAAQQHGGPYPATTAPNSTSVGMTAITRFMRPVAYQNMPDVLLPPALQNANPLGIWRKVNNQFTKEAL